MDIPETPDPCLPMRPTHTIYHCGVCSRLSPRTPTPPDRSSCSFCSHSHRNRQRGSRNCTGCIVYTFETHFKCWACNNLEPMAQLICDEHGTGHCGCLRERCEACGERVDSSSVMVWKAGVYAAAGYEDLGPLGDEFDEFWVDEPDLGKEVWKKLGEVVVREGRGREDVGLFISFGNWMVRWIPLSSFGMFSTVIRIDPQSLTFRICVSSVRTDIMSSIAPASPLRFCMPSLHALPPITYLYYRLCTCTTLQTSTWTPCSHCPHSHAIAAGVQECGGCLLYSFQSCYTCWSCETSNIYSSSNKKCWYFGFRFDSSCVLVWRVELWVTKYAGWMDKVPTEMLEVYEPVVGERAKRLLRYVKIN